MKTKILLLVFISVWTLGCDGGSVTTTSTNSQNVNINPEPNCEEKREIDCGRRELEVKCGDETLAVISATCADLKAFQCQDLPDECKEEEMIEEE